MEIVLFFLEIGDKFDVDDVKEDMYVDLWKDVEGNEEERMKKYRSWSIKQDGREGNLPLGQDNGGAYSRMAQNKCSDFD